MSDQPKPTGECTCDNASGLHWGKCPLNIKPKPTSERPCPKCGYVSCLDLSSPSLQRPVIAMQPKPTGEWRYERVAEGDDYHVIVCAILEIVATVRELSAISLVRCHNAALAAEREKVQTLVDLLNDMKRLEPKFATFIDAALAKVKEGK